MSLDKKIKLQFRLGTGIAKRYPFVRIPVIKKQKDYSVINNKVLIVFGIVAVVKIAILLTLF